MVKCSQELLMISWDYYFYLSYTKHLNWKKERKGGYEIDNVRNVEYGFHDCYGESWEAKYFDSVNAIFEGNCWEELDPEEDVDYITPMSIEEIEKELGYKIKIVSKK